MARRRPRAMRRWSTYPLVAAATILVIASAALASPVKQWIVRARGGDRAVGPAATSMPTVVAHAPTGVGPTVSFAPTDTALTLGIANRQAAGTLEVTRTDKSSISARITGGGSDEDLLITRSGLQIRNAATSRADYRVEVPAGVKVILLTIGQAVERTIVIGQATHEVISLALKP